MKKEQLYGAAMIGAVVIAALIAWKYVSAQQGAATANADLTAQGAATASTLAAQEQNALLSQQLTALYPFVNSTMGVSGTVGTVATGSGASGATPVGTGLTLATMNPTVSGGSYSNLPAPVLLSPSSTAARS
jgi:hypothetical protein